jgi:hypothetical protein
MAMPCAYQTLHPAIFMMKCADDRRRCAYPDYEAPVIVSLADGNRVVRDTR